MTAKRFFFFIIIVALLVGGALYYYTTSRSDTFVSGGATQQDGQTLSDAEIAQVIAGTGRHIQLPTGEDPLIASIVDVETLVASQPFYQGAKNGDILLVYVQAAKAIIYSPSRDILVNVGPVILDESAAEGAAAEIPVSAPAEEVVEQ